MARKINVEAQIQSLLSAVSALAGEVKSLKAGAKAPKAAPPVPAKKSVSKGESATGRPALVFVGVRPKAVTFTIATLSLAIECLDAVGVETVRKLLKTK